MTNAGVLASDAVGEFSLTPAQGPVRSVFVSLARLQRDLTLQGRANVVLLGGAGNDRTASLAAALPGALRTAVTAADLGLTIEAGPAPGSVIVESKSGLIPDAVASAIESTAQRESLTVSPVLTWLATRLTVRDRSVPYSIVTAVTPSIGESAALNVLEPSPSAAGGPPPIVLTAWTARELDASAGDSLELEYYRWTDAGLLATEQATFRVAGILPMEGLAVDRRLAPDYPGITSSDSFADWDPPFPIDLKRVRPADEAYWKTYRTAPKGFVPLAVGQRIWQTKYGRVTSLRLHPPSNATASSADAVDRLAALRASIVAWRGSGARGTHRDRRAIAESVGFRGRDRLRRLLFVLQLLPHGVGALADGSVLQIEHRATPLGDRRPSRDRLCDPYRAEAVLDRRRCWSRLPARWPVRCSPSAGRRS